MPTLITLRAIQDHQPCVAGWNAILEYQGGDNADFSAEFPLSDAINCCPLEYIIWALRCLPSPLVAQHFAWGCAEMVKHLMTDQRSVDAVDALAKYLAGSLSAEDMRAARDDAYTAAYDTCPASGAVTRGAYDAARAASAASVASSVAYADTLAHAAAYAAVRTADASHEAACRATSQGLRKAQLVLLLSLLDE